MTRVSTVAELQCVEFVTVAELACVLRCSEEYIRKLIRCQVLQARRLGQDYRIPRAAALELVIPTQQAH